MFKQITKPFSFNMSNLSKISDIIKKLQLNDNVHELLVSKNPLITHIVNDRFSINYVVEDVNKSWEFNLIELDIGLTELCFKSDTDLPLRTMSEVILLIGCGVNNLLSSPNVLSFHQSLDTILRNSSFIYNMFCVINDMCQIGYLFKNKDTTDHPMFINLLTSITFNFAKYYSNYFHNTDECVEYSFRDIIERNDIAEIIGFMLLGKLVLSTLTPNESQLNNTIISNKDNNNKASQRIGESVRGGKPGEGEKKKPIKPIDEMANYLDNTNTTAVNDVNSFNTFKSLQNVESNKMLTGEKVNLIIPNLNNLLPVPVVRIQLATRMNRPNPAQKKVDLHQPDVTEKSITINSKSDSMSKKVGDVEITDQVQSSTQKIVIEKKKDNRINDWGDVQYDDDDDDDEIVISKPVVTETVRRDNGLVPTKKGRILD